MNKSFPILLLLVLLLSSATQAQQDYYVHFPDDKLITSCTGNWTDYGVPTFLELNGATVVVSYEDEMITVVPDACYTIERTWTVSNINTYDAGLPCVSVPNPQPHVVTNHPDNLPGPIVSPISGQPGDPWEATVVKVLPTDAQPTDYTTFYVSNANCYQYQQHIKVIDTAEPVVTACPTAPLDICDLTPNDPLLWNETGWWDPSVGSHDLPDAPTDLTITATDDCSGSNVVIRYLLFLDLDQDGTMETVVNSANLPPADTVYVGNSQNPNFSGGTARAFDERPVLAEEKYRFALQQVVNGANVTASVRWNTTAAPGTFALPELPYGMHKIKWIIGDNCGNETVCEYTFIVRDCKKPTVVCLNGPSVNLMPTQQITMWASDFLQYVQDNVSPADLIQLAIVKSVDGGNDFPVDAQGNPLTSVTFDCDEIGTQLVQLWARDVAGNADFCETYVLVQDNMGVCGDSTYATVAACVEHWCDGSPIAGVNLQLDGTSPALPPISLFGLMNADSNGACLAFQNALPMTSTYALTPTLDSNPLNGVTFYDLYLINKHILGLQPLPTYAQIAADANKSGTITTYDISEFRKLLLGIYAELPANTSWRFVDASFTFPEPGNAFLTAFPESITADIQATSLTDLFYGIKIGDVDCSAYPGFGPAQPDDRRNVALSLPDLNLPADAVVDVPLTLPAGEWLGGQWGLQFDPAQLTIESVTPAPLDGLDADTWAQPQPGRFNVVWAPASAQRLAVGEALLTLRLRTHAPIRLSEAIHLSASPLAPEARTGTEEPCRLRLDFQKPSTPLAKANPIRIGAPLPNPTAGAATLPIYLPEAASVRLEVIDLAGRLLYANKENLPAGSQRLGIPAAAMTQAGVYGWRVLVGETVATGRLMRQ